MTSESTDRLLSEARAWLDQHATRRDGASERQFDLAEAKWWQAQLYDRGLVGTGYPTAYGGRDLPETTTREIEALLHQYELPFEYFAIGLGMCAPTLLALGTEQQRRRYLPPLLRGEEIWCQLFSEPGAGSDLASLQTRAVRRGDGWVVNGQKVWSSGAHHSDFGILLARTDPDVPKHKGITMFVLDMHKPGVTVRPLQQITGRSRFNEVFFNDVELSDEDIVGGLNQGWAAAISTLNFERVSVAGWDWNRSARLTAANLRDRAAQRGATLTPADRRRLAQLHASQVLVESLIRMHTEEAEAGSFQSARGSVAKLAESWHKNLCVDVACAVAGFDLLAEPPDSADSGQLLTDVLATRGSLVAGGTDEIQKNIVGERLLGLPPETRVDKNVPFRDLTVGTRRHASSGPATEA